MIRKAFLEPQQACPAPWPVLVFLGRNSGRPPLVLRYPVNLIGKGQDCTVPLESASLSTHHAMILQAPDGLQIRDLARRNGVMVNGRPMREAQLENGDELSIGEYRFRLIASEPVTVHDTPTNLEINSERVTIPSTARILLIGRDPVCDVRFAGEGTDGQHALLLLAGEKRFIRDLNSETGTWVNDEAVVQKSLHDGDVIRIGTAMLRMLPTSPAGEAIVPVIPIPEPGPQTAREAEQVPTPPPAEADQSLIKKDRPRQRQRPRIRIRTPRRPEPTRWIPWPLYFTWYLLGTEAALVFLGNTPLRFPLRMAAYGGSLGMLMLFPPRFQTHPALKLLKWLPVLLVIGLFHPEHNTFMAGLAQILQYVAIYAPLAWVAAAKPDFKMFRLVLLALWGFNLASATTGVLQVYFPGHFVGATSDLVSARSNFQKGASDVILADGTKILRPFGLTDTPGGAAEAGLNAIILGAGVLLAERKQWLRLIAAGGLPLSVFAIFLSQVRVELVMSGLCGLVLIFMLARRGEWKSVFVMSGGLVAVALASAAWAFAVGGSQTISRFATLTAGNPTDVYSANRGFFIDSFFNHDIETYPFGAGLGRWGMVNFYFGDRGTQLWSEIMWTAWLYDGGIPLVLLYMTAFGLAIWVSWKLAVTRSGPLGLWSSVLLSFNLAALAGTFVFPLFAIQAGLEIWLVNACLFSASLAPAAVAESDSQKKPAPTDGPGPRGDGGRKTPRTRRRGFAESRRGARMGFGRPAI